MNSQTLPVVVAHEIVKAVVPLLSDPHTASEMGVIVKDKGHGHTAHRIDTRAEEVLFDVLRREGYSGTVFSEESGLVKMGHQARLIIADPYCNTTLTFRGIRESAVAVYEYSSSGQFVSGAIADVQIPRIIWATEGSGAFTTALVPEARTTSARCSNVENVENAFISISLMKRSRREELPLALMRNTGNIWAVDGAIIAARVALGELDGFVDARIGQPSYEAMAYMLVVQAGGVVSDSSGAAIDFSSIARGLADGHVGRHTIIATSTASLRDDVLALLADS